MANTLLIVEDNPIVREWLGVILEREGYFVILTANGREALDYLRKYPTPSLILLDMLIPRFDGWWFLKQYRRDSSLAAIPVVIMTGIDVASQEWSLALGAVGLLRKPFEVDQLLKQVRRHCGTARPVVSFSITRKKTTVS